MSHSYYLNAVHSANKQYQSADHKYQPITISLYIRQYVYYKSCDIYVFFCIFSLVSAHQMPIYGSYYRHSVKTFLYRPFIYQIFLVDVYLIRSSAYDVIMKYVAS